jgi:hypothetical protein
MAIIVLIKTVNYPLKKRAFKISNFSIDFELKFLEFSRLLTFVWKFFKEYLGCIDWFKKLMFWIEEFNSCIS